jgi:arylsulfatase
MMRRPTTAALITLALMSFLGEPRNSEAAERPNIVLVMVDDLGFSDFGCYGSEIETPTIDSLAENGLRFRQFYNTAKCHSSRVCLMTGMYCHQASSSKLANAVTIAEVLRDAGYFTIMTGKWHLSKQPTERGFMRYFGHLSGATNFFTGDKTFRLNGQPWSEFGKDFYTTDVNIDYGITFIDEALAEKKPFFVYVAFNAPHYPLQAPKEDCMKYAGRYDAGFASIRAARFAKQKRIGLIPEDWRLPPRPDHVTAWDKLTEADKKWEARRMSVFAAMVDRVDRNMGRLVRHLKNKGAYENTVILICSDNGACPFERTRGKDKDPWDPASYWTYDTGWAHVCNTPLKYYKQNQHEGGISSPMIAHWPAGMRASGFTDEMSHLVDVMATCIELAGTKYPAEYNGESMKPLVGKSLVPTLRGQPRDGHKDLFFEFGSNSGMRRGKWKAVNYRGGAWELYDISVDRLEQNDLASQHPDLVKDLAARWAEIKGRPAKVRSETGTPSPGDFGGGKKGRGGRRKKQNQ